MFIEAISEEAATGATADWYAGERESWGFVPDYAFAFGTRPDVAAAWGTLVRAVRAGVDPRRYELITIAAARAARSTGCTVAHSMFLRDDVGDEATMLLTARDPSGNSLEPVDRAVYQFAAKVAGDSVAIDQADVDRVRAAGLSDAEIADVVYIAAARRFLATVLDSLGSQLDPRVPKGLDSDLLASMIVGRPVADS